MKPLVLDCSVTLSWCFQDESNKYSDRILDYIKKNSALVPNIWPLEFTNGLLNGMKHKRITEDGTLNFIELFSKLPIRVISLSVSECFSEVLSLANDFSLSSYDASYLYLAIKNKVSIATFDKALMKAAEKKKVLYK